MKLLVRWSVIASLLGGSFLGAGFLKPNVVIALPEAEVLARLQSIPVFTVTNAQGSPVLASNPQEKNGPQVATFFVSQKEAQSFLTQVKAKNAELGKTAKVVPTPLGKAVEVARKNKEKNVAFQFVPTQEDVKSAEALLRKQDPNFKQFNDVPLFYGMDTKTKGLLSLASPQEKGKIIPLYFNQKDLQVILDQLKKENPQLGATTQIQVTSLSNVVASMLKENNPEISQLTLIPSAESRAFLSTLPQSGSAPQKP